MPKEYVVTDAEARLRDETGGAMVGVRVGWERGVLVQLATVVKAGCDGGYPGQDIAVKPDEGVFVDLDRDAINRLIRLLRKARDQGLGQDA